MHMCTYVPDPCLSPPVRRTIAGSTWCTGLKVLHDTSENALSQGDSLSHAGAAHQGFPPKNFLFLSVQAHQLTRRFPSANYKHVKCHRDCLGFGILPPASKVGDPLLQRQKGYLS